MSIELLTHADKHPARGAHVVVTLTSGKHVAGTVVSFPGQALMVHFTGAYSRTLAHPAWRIAETPDTDPRTQSDTTGGEQ